MRTSGSRQTSTVLVDGIGEVKITRRVGMTRIKISVSSRGVLLSMPWATPKLLAVSFLKKHRDWILTQTQQQQAPPINHGDVIGSGHTVSFRPVRTSRLRSTVTTSAITVYHPDHMPSHHPDVQHKAQSTALKALRVKAEIELPPRLAKLSEQYNLPFSSVSVRQMTSRWGSCSSSQHITLSIFLMQLPEPLIDYVLTHELTHTKHMDHSPRFWDLCVSCMPDARKRRTIMKQYRPVLQVHSTVEASSIGGNEG